MHDACSRAALRSLGAAALLCGLSAAAAARADEPAQTPAPSQPAGPRFEGALRVGIADSPDTPQRWSTYFLSLAPRVSTPVGLDLGVRLDGHWLLGGFANHSLGGSPVGGCYGTCTSAITQAGLQAQWHPIGRAAGPDPDPWLGLGAGYQWIRFTDSRMTSDDRPGAVVAGGWLLAFGGGVGVWSAAHAAVDFYANVTVANASERGTFPDPHLWLAAGVRLTLR